MKNKTVITNNFEETQDIAREFVNELKDGDAIALYGDLGSGKTTFAQGLAKGFGIEKRIISPTFVIVRTYRITNHELRIKNFYHIDLYRTESKRDIDVLGIREIIEDSGNIVVIEWAEKLGNLLPEKRWDITFEYIADTKRKIIFEHKHARTH